MKTQQLHQVLNAVWAVVADANRYFASEAPWALAKTDPQAAGHDPLRDRRSASGRSPSWRSLSCRPSAAKLLDILAVPADERDFARLGGVTASRRASALPQPAPVFPRYVEPEAGGA